jgi:superfamily II DNA/RNA helicase
VERAACIQHIEYQVLKTEEEYWTDMERTIKEKAAEEPVIVFLDKKKNIDAVKQICTKLGISFFQVAEDR